MKSMYYISIDPHCLAFKAKRHIVVGHDYYRDLGLKK